MHDSPRAPRAWWWWRWRRAFQSSYSSAFSFEQGAAVGVGYQRLLPCFPTPDAAGGDVLMFFPRADILGLEFVGEVATGPYLCWGIPVLLPLRRFGGAHRLRMRFQPLRAFTASARMSRCSSRSTSSSAGIGTSAYS